MLAAMVDDSFMEGFIFVGIKVGLMWNASYLSFRSYYIFLYVDCSSILRASSIMDGLSIECFIFVGIKVKVGPIGVLHISSF